MFCLLDLLFALVLIHIGSGEYGACKTFSLLRNMVMKKVKQSLTIRAHKNPRNRPFRLSGDPKQIIFFALLHLWALAHFCKKNAPTMHVMFTSLPAVGSISGSNLFHTAEFNWSPTKTTPWRRSRSGRFGPRCTGGSAQPE